MAAGGLERVAGCFEFRLAGEGGLDGHGSFIIEAMPRKGYQTRSGTAKVFRSLKGRFWRAQQDRPIVKVEAEVIDTIRQVLSHLVSEPSRKFRFPAK